MSRSFGTDKHDIKFNVEEYENTTNMTGSHYQSRHASSPLLSVVTDDNTNTIPTTVYSEKLLTSPKVASLDQVKHIMLRTVDVFRPRLPRMTFWNELPDQSKLGPTAWMEGFRGIAALVVFNFHYLFAFTDMVSVGYGFDDEHRHLLELPFVQLIVDGASAVNIFFAVAGYVCSIRALQLLSQATPQTEKALRGLSSSVFRRFFRLYLPVFFVTFVAAVAAQLGVFDILRPMMEKKKTYFRGPSSEMNLAREPTILAQLGHWYRDVFDLCNVWQIKPVYPEHDPHLWTIPFEFRMSMHLYICLIGLALCRPRVRLGGLVLLGFLYILWDRWEGHLFMFGAALAQWDVIQNMDMATSSAGKLPRHEPAAQQKSSSAILTSGGQERGEAGMAAATAAVINQRTKTAAHWLCSSSSHPRPRSRRIFRAFCYLLAFYLMSFPTLQIKRPTWTFLWINSLIPRYITRKEKFPKALGVLLLMMLLMTSRNKSSSSSSSSLSNKDSETNQISIGHRILTSKPAQYLGRIKFSFYLVHGNILHAVGYGIPHAVWKVTGQTNNFTYVTGLLCGWFFSLVVCFYIAEIFEREVVERSVRWFRHFEKWCLL